MEVYVRIPRENMHDAAIQTLDEKHDQIASEKSVGKSLNSRNGNNFNPPNTPQTTPTSQPMELGLSLPERHYSYGDNAWHIENSTPRPSAAVSPQPRSNPSYSQKAGVVGRWVSEADPRVNLLSNHTAQLGGVHGVLDDPNMHLNVSISAELGTSDWMKDKDQGSLDPTRIKFNKSDLNMSIDSSRNEQCPSASSTTSGRSVNERLDNYMVIRQRTFHGLPRSKKELQVLPLTDPRDERHGDSHSPSWVHRSKTDLFIERRRAKLQAQQLNKRNANTMKGIDISGMTFANLMDNLPNTQDTGSIPSVKPSNSKHQSESTNQSDSKQSQSGDSGDANTKFPPISINKMKVMIEKDIDGCEKLSSPRPLPGRSTSVTSSSSIQSACQPDSPRNAKSCKGKLRKQSLAAIPLRLWEPSFDCVVMSSRKVLQPRRIMRSWSEPVRQQPSPLK